MRKRISVDEVCAVAGTRIPEFARGEQFEVSATIFQGGGPSIESFLADLQYDVRIGVFRNFLLSTKGVVSVMGRAVLLIGVGSSADGEASE